MTGDTRITRTVETDLGPEELWELVSTGDGWAAWLADEADVDVAPGASGRVVDDGEVRRVRIDDVRPGERVAFTWWPDDGVGSPSIVELTVAPGRLTITETHRPASVASASTASAWRWDVRLLCLAVHGVAAHV